MKFILNGQEITSGEGSNVNKTLEDIFETPIEISTLTKDGLFNLAKQTEENGKKFGCVYIDRYKNIFYYYIGAYFTSSSSISSLNYRNIPYGYMGSLYFYGSLYIENSNKSYTSAIVYVEYTNVGQDSYNSGILINDPTNQLAYAGLYVGALKE